LFQASYLFSQDIDIIIRLKDSKLKKTIRTDSILFQSLKVKFGDFQIKSLIPQKKQILAKVNSQNPFSKVFILKLNKKQFTQNLLDSLNALSEIEYACQNHVLKIHENVNDPEFDKQWGMAKIHIQEAWLTTKGSPDVPVVVIDTGIDMSHDDLKNQIWVNPGEDLNGNDFSDSSDYNGIDDDDNGYIDDLVGWDFVDASRYPDGGDYLEPDNDPSDEHGHGTSVSGILAAESNNGVGIAGVAPKCKIVNLRAGTSQGLLEEDDVAAAILYAVDMKFRIINMSFGDVLITPLLRDVIQYAYKNDIIMIASAGNSGNDEIHYPSGLAETISVGATIEADYLASFSSFGSSLDLVAPGNAIFTTVLDNKYDEVGGTSAAAPFVSGVAALLLSENPELSSELVRNRIQQACDDLGDPGWDFEYGAGLLRADRSLQDFGDATVKIVSPKQDQGFNSGNVPIIGTCAGALISGYEISVGEGLNPIEWETLFIESNRQIISDTLSFWQVPTSNDTVYTFRLRGLLRDSRSLDDYVSVFVDHTNPIVSNFEIFPVLNGNEEAFLFRFTSDDFTRVKLLFRSSSSTDEFLIEELLFRNTIHSGLINNTALGDLEYYFEIKNRAGLQSTYPETLPLLQIKFKENENIFELLEPQDVSFGPGYFLDFVSDFDNDGNPEVVMNEYGENGNFGFLTYWEFQNDKFVRVSKSEHQLIPRDIADVNGDNKPEVLAGAGKASIILSPTSSEPFPIEIVWFDTNDVWASRLFDFNKDDYPELIAKIGNDWKLWQNNKDYSFSPFSDLPNQTDGDNGTGIPHVEIGDFDDDGLNEILFGDYDGSVYLFEISSDLNATFEWSDQLPLIDAIDFLASGDYDGDGQLEFAVGCHSGDNLDLEHQFDDRHWFFRIYDFSFGAYQTMWEQRFLPFFPPKDFDSGLSSGDLNSDSKEELLISIYPNLYVVSYDSTNSEYKILGNHFNVKSNKILAYDFDGKKNILLNNGQQNRLFNFRDGGAVIPMNPINLQAVALDSNHVKLTWENFVQPDSFRIYRNTEQERLDLLASGWTQKMFIDSTVLVDQQYWYQVSRLQGNSSESYSKKVTVIPHRPARIENVKIVPPNQILLTFSLPMSEAVQNTKNFILSHSSVNPETAAQSPNLREVLLSWSVGLPKLDTLKISNITDSSGTPLDLGGRMNEISNEIVTNDMLYIVRAEFKSSKILQLEFNGSVELQGLLNPENYRVEPDIEVQSVKSIDASNNLVNLELSSSRPIGPIGTQYDLYVKNLIGQSGVSLNQEIGHQITFLFVANDLKNVYVYPNPAKTYLKFAQLTSSAEIEIYNSSGIKIQNLEINTLDGGFEWNLFDENQSLVPSGIYLYRVFNENESHWGKFAIVR